MNEKGFNRRDFLKLLSRMGLSALVLSLGKIERWIETNQAQRPTHLKEARYYVSNDPLAG